MHKLTVAKCIDVCSQSAFPYAGVSGGNECYCGSQKPPADQLLNRSYCSVPCVGRSGQYCGGIGMTEVFDTGVPARKSVKLRESSAVNNGTGKARIAFILTLNGRGLRQVTRLLRTIYRPHHTYYIHVDARQDYLYRNLLPLESKYANVRLSRQRQTTIWGGASLLDVLLEAMGQLLRMNPRWSYVFNLSESDFPLKSVDRLEDFLAANRGRNFLKSHGRQARQFIHKQGLDRVFHQCESRMWRVGDRTLPSGIRFDGGSDWFGLSRDFVAYAVNGDDALVTGLKQLFRYTLLPAESFFHVLVLNSKFCHTYADNNLRMTLWRRSQGCLCQHRHVVDWCGCSPMVFRTSDWSSLSPAVSAGSIHFARKFEAVIDQSVINRLEEMLTNSTITYPGWDSYWENVYQSTGLVAATDAALLAVCMSVGQQALRTIQDQAQRCPLQVIGVVEVNSYFYRDEYKGAAILYDVLLNGQEFQLETLVKPSGRTKIYRSMSNLQVGDQYDPKEQVLRNRMGVLCQLSKPVAFYNWSGYLSTNGTIVHFVWFDPFLHVKAVHQVNISDTAKVFSVRHR